MNQPADDIPRVFNLLPLLSGGKANRVTPIGRFEIPQRFWRPIVIGSFAGLLAMGFDEAFGSLIVSWWFLAVLIVSIVALRIGQRGKPAKTAVDFWTWIAAGAWSLFPAARLVSLGVGAAPVIGGLAGRLGWPILGAVLVVLSYEARSRSGANRAEAILASGRSTNLAGQLHLGLWPVPEIDGEVRWCDGGVPNPTRTISR